MIYWYRYARVKTLKIRSKLLFRHFLNWHEYVVRVTGVPLFITCLRWEILVDNHNHVSRAWWLSYGTLNSSSALYVFVSVLVCMQSLWIDVLARCGLTFNREWVFLSVWVINGFFASSIFEIPLRLKVILVLVQLHAWNLIFDFLSMVTCLTLYASWYIFVSINISFTGVITLLNGINFKTLWISRRTP